jgi:hypothetical protein
MKYKLIFFQERLDTMRERKDGLKHQLADIKNNMLPPRRREET